MESSHSLQLGADVHAVGPSRPFPPHPMPQAHGIATSHGDVNVAGRDVHVHKYCQDHSSRIDIVAALDAVRNLRNVHLGILSKVTPGTGGWLLKTDKFLIWLDPNGNLKILWGTGIPGAGKTFLASIVIRELEARAAVAGSRICVCYIYIRYSDRAELTVRNILEVFVKQTVERHPDCALLAEQAYARHLREKTQPTEAELLQLLHQFTEIVAAIFYILDALDEAPDRIQVDLVKTLASLNVRLFITSRPLEAVQPQAPGAHHFTVVATEGDLELHIAQEIARSRDLQGLLGKVGPSLRNEIVSLVKSKCGGMFLHASLQLEAVCECVTAREVRRTLEAFPSRIEDVYRQTWDRILEQKAGHALLAQAVLVWVLNASRSMTIDELERAAATAPDTFEFEPDQVAPGATLIALCRGLVTFEEESKLVRLVHYTAKDTLQGLLRDSFPHPHSHLAMVCMKHLTQCGFQNTMLRTKDEFNAALEVDPLLAYASDAWATHACESLHIEGTRRRTANFVSKSTAFPTFTGPALFDILGPLHILAIYNLPISLIAHDNIGDPNVPTKIYRHSPLTLASWHGHERAVLSLLAHPEIQVNHANYDLRSMLIADMEDPQGGARPEMQVGMTGHEGWSPLMVAAANGWGGVFTLLLAHPEIQVNLVSHCGRRSALMLATVNGHKGIVALLLARPEIHVNLVDNRGWSALMLAASNGHKDIVKLLLAHPEVRVNLVDKERWSPLMWATRYGHEGAVSLLLAHPKVQVNLTDGKGWSALMLGASCGHVGVVTSILAHPDVRVNFLDDEGWSALMKAASNGDKSIVTLLLAHPEILVNLVNDKRWSALMLAAGHGHESVVTLLLAYPNIQVNLVSNTQWSALMLAMRRGHEGIFKILLARADIQVNPADDGGWSALAKAARDGHEHFVKLLLAYPGIEVNLVTNGGWTALMLASANGHEGIVRLLLARPDTQVNLANDEQWSALMLAARRGHGSVVALLLTCPEIQLNMVEYEGWSSLMLATRCNQEGIVTLLLARSNIQVNLIDNRGWSAFMLAASNGHKGIAALLLAHPEIQVNLVNNGGWSALMLAAWNGHKGIAALLIALPELLVNLVNLNRQSALMLAARNGQESIVKLLLARPEIQVNLVDSDGRSALMLAARRGHKGNVKLLLAHPEIQVNLVDNDGWLALMLAAKYGHEDIVPLLLAHPQTLGLGQTSQASSAGPPTPVRQPTSVAIQTGLDLRTISLRSGSADASSSSIIVAEVFKNGSGDGSPGGEDMEDEGTNNHATHDEGADDQRAERESSGSKRTAKRCRGNEEDSLQGPFDDMAAPSPKRHCGAPVAEGSLPRRRTLNTPASKVVSSPTN